MPANARSRLSPVEEELLDLRDLVDELKGEIRARDEAYARLDAFPPEWELKRAERLALSALARAGGSPVSSVGLRLRLYGDVCFSKDKTLHVTISRLRAKVAPAGVRIRALRHFGYTLEAGSLDRLRPFIAQTGHH